jgi:hypothetical protein
MDPKGLLTCCKSLPVDRILSQMNPLHIFASCFFFLRFILMLCLQQEMVSLKI